MDTDGGGWTLVWSYAFTDYENFKSKANAVSPSPEWPDISADIDVPVSTTPPLHEHDFNALDFSLWKKLGQEIFVKSNVNNWLVCSPRGGSFVDWTPGKISCKIANKIAGTHCADGSPPVKILFKDCGPQLLRRNKSYYYFVSCTKYRWPIHDPCAKNQENQLRDVQDPHGSIFVRWAELPRRNYKLLFVLSVISCCSLTISALCFNCHSTRFRSSTDKI